MKVLFLLHCFFITFISGQLLRPSSFFRNIPSDLYSNVGHHIFNLQNAFRTDLLWCGYRDIAPFPEAVSAVYPNLDHCCRMHDNCPLIIDRGDCLDDICNKSFVFPILNCKCEREFRNCLHGVSRRRDTNNVRYPVSPQERILSGSFGFGYFRLFPSISERQCVEKTKPFLGCSENYYGKCNGMIFDEDGQERWQLFKLRDIIPDNEPLF